MMIPSNWATDMLPLLGTIFLVLCGILGIAVFAILVIIIWVRGIDLAQKIIRRKRDRET